MMQQAARGELHRARIRRSFGDVAASVGYTTGYPSIPTLPLRQTPTGRGVTRPEAPFTGFRRRPRWADAGPRPPRGTRATRHPGGPPPVSSRHRQPSASPAVVTQFLPVCVLVVALP